MIEDFDSLIGRTIVIGITRLDADGNLIEQVQMHGVVVEIVKDSVKIELSSRQFYWLPADKRAFSPAPPGEYRFRSTGEIVVNPDFMSTWTVHAPAEKGAEEAPKD